jgi:cobalt-zinc-cadmium efflux system membrane fusion protein
MKQCHPTFNTHRFGSPDNRGWLTRWLLGSFGLALVWALLPVPAYADRSHDEATESAAEEIHEHEEERAVRLPREVQQEFGITVDTARAGKLEIAIELPGEVAVNRERTAHVTPRFPGVVKEVYKSIGDTVSAGDPLALIESNEALSTYTLRASIDGVIIDRHMTVGEFHAEADDPAFVIADLDTVWIDLSVYQIYLSQVRVGQQVTIYGLNHYQGINTHIAYVSPVVDEATRTAVARIILPNLDGRWRPGMFVTGRIIVDEVSVPVAVPQTALQTVEGQTAVFVETSEGFTPQPVKTGRSDGTHVEIVAGLQPGQPYVAEGGFTLKAELSKSAFSGGHGH